MNFMHNDPPRPTHPLIVDWAYAGSDQGPALAALAESVQLEWALNVRVHAILTLARSLGPEELLGEIILALKDAPEAAVEPHLFAIQGELVARN